MKVRSLRMLTAVVVVALSTVGLVRAAEPKNPTVMTGDATWKAQPIADAPMACESDSCKSERRFGLIGEFMYLSPRGVDVPFARIADGCGGDAVTRGALGIAQPDYSPAYRFGGWFDLTDCSGIQLTYSRLESHTNASSFTGGNFVIQSLVTLPQTLNCASNSLGATARYNIDFDLVDLDYGHNLWKGCNATIDWIVGIRYAHLDQDFQSSFTIQNATNVNTTVNFEGIGPRVGLQGEKRIGCGGFFFYGNGTLDLLAGNFRSDFLQRNRFTGVQGNVTLTMIASSRSSNWNSASAGRTRAAASRCKRAIRWPAGLTS